MDNNNNNVTPENNISADNNEIVNNGVIENNKKSGNGLVLLAIIGGLIIAVGVVLGILIGNKDDKKNSKEKDLPSSVLSKVKTSGQMMIGKDSFRIEASAKDTLLSLVKDKSNLYGVKLGIKGKIDKGFCQYNPETINYQFVDVDSNSPLFKTDGNDSMNLKLDSLKGVKSAYYLGFGGCDSFADTPLLIQFSNKLLFYSPYNDDEPIEIKVDKEYAMFYSLNLSTGVCDVACNEGITSYLIGETSDGTMYIIDKDGTTIDVKDVKIDAKVINYEDFADDEGEGLKNFTTTIYGITMSSGAKTFESFAF